MSESADEVKTLTRREMVRLLSDRTGLDHRKMAEILEETLGLMTEELAQGNRIELRNFGVLEVFEGGARTGRNPLEPSETISVPARAKVRFRPGKALREKVARILPQIRMRE